MKTLALVLGIVLVAATCCVQGQQFCGPMDVVLVVDTTGSMQPSINNIKVGLTNIIAAADQASGGDVRFGLVTFGVGFNVDSPFSCAVEDVISRVNALVATGGNNLPEDSDAALEYVVTGTNSLSCVLTEPHGSLGSFRAGALKIVVLVTDAAPAGCDDTYTDGIDDVHAELVAMNAAARDIHISAVLVGGATTTTAAHPNGVQNDVMQGYASTSHGFFTTVPSTGTGAGDAIQSILASCGGGTAGGGSCVTRTSRFWFTHSKSDDPNCVTLKKSLETCSGIVLGFISLPVENRTPDNLVDAEDAMIEALSFYWRNRGITGEENGTQTEGVKASLLCTARKKLAVELIAATANVRTLGASPSVCTYFNGISQTNFPADLLPQARAAASDYNIATIKRWRVLLRRFNRSGVTNNFTGNLVECSALRPAKLRALARDPSTYLTCPGLNDSCETATVVVFPTPKNIFQSRPFTATASLNRLGNNFTQVSSCANGSTGPTAVWRILPSDGATGRNFTVTASCNFRPVLTVWSAAGTSCANLAETTCAINGAFFGRAQVQFRTDGTNSFLITVGGQAGAVGRVNLRITSP